MRDNNTPTIKVENLILEILKEEWNNGNKQILTIKLIKLLYLTEYEYYKLKRQRLTNLRWIFYKYGPFAFELKKIQSNILQLEEEEKVLDSGRVIKLLGVSWDMNFVQERFVENIEVVAITKRLTHQWKDSNKNELLNFVYHHTEPMMVANRGEVLDFSVIAEPQLLLHTKISEEKVRELRKHFKYGKSQELRKPLYPLPELSEEWKKKLRKAFEALEIEDTVILPKHL